MSAGHASSPGNSGICGVAVVAIGWALAEPVMHRYEHDASARALRDVAYAPTAIFSIWLTFARSEGH